MPGVEEGLYPRTGARESPCLAVALGSGARAFFFFKDEVEDEGDSSGPSSVSGPPGGDDDGEDVRSESGELMLVETCGNADWRMFTLLLRGEVFFFSF